MMVTRNSFVSLILLSLIVPISTQTPIIVSIYSSELTLNSETYSRDGGSEGNYYYEAIEVRVNTTGTYTFKCSSSIGDTYGYIYQGNFYPSYPSYNIVTKDGDSAGNGQFQLTATLRSDITYILVFTTYYERNTGSFSIVTSGPDNVFNPMEVLQTTTTGQITSSYLNINMKWKQEGITVAGGNGPGQQLNQLSSPYGIYVDDDHQCIYIADHGNHRIVEWESNANIGQVIANGNGAKIPLNSPRDVIVDTKDNSLLICDTGNRRIVRWSRESSTNGETIISNIACRGLAMDNNGDLYVSDVDKNDVRRWKIGEINGIIVAGGNDGGNALNQLNYPSYIFVDQDHSVYVSDTSNNRVMKWIKGAQEGIVVAGGEGQGNLLTQLSDPRGVTVDYLGNVYVAESGNNRITCWSSGSKEGRIIVGGNGQGKQPNQFNGLRDLSFDRQYNLYVVDSGNNRVQKFDIDLN